MRRRIWVIGTAIAALTAAPLGLAAPQGALADSSAARLSHPDDLTALGGHLFVGYQNGVGPKGEPSPTGQTRSAVAEVNSRGHVRQLWWLPGKCDGLTADPTRHRLLATVNEDGDSALYAIYPQAHPAAQIRRYNYRPRVLPHGGGTDAVSIYHGQILIAASAPTTAGGPATYRVTLHANTADLTPLFGDHARAVVANRDASNHGQTVRLALTDPDSNAVVPAASPRFAGDFELTSQAEQVQIYVRDPGQPTQRLSVLHLSAVVNDTAWITSRRGTLYLTDNTTGRLLSLTGSFTPGQAYVTAATPNGTSNYLGRLDLATGHVTPILTGLTDAAGLLYLPAT